MKKSIKLILSIIILVLLIVALKFIPASSDKEEAGASPSPSASEDISVVSLKPEEVASVDVTEGSTTVTYLPPTGDGSWSIQSAAELKVSTDTLNYRLGQVIELNATRKLDSTDLSEFGLDHPAKTVTYHLKDNTTKQLFVGSTTLDNGSAYVMLDGDPTIYLIADTQNKCITTDLSVFNDTTLSDFAPDSFIIDTLEFSGNDISPVTFTLSDEQNGVVACYDFTMDDFKGISVSNSAMESIKAAFPDFSTIENFVAANVTDLSQYGLDDPSFHMVIKYAVKDSDDASKSSQPVETLDLTFGKKLEDGKTAFYIGGNKTNVYSMDGSFIAAIKALLTPFGLCNKYLAIPMITDVKAIDIHFADSDSKYHLNVDSDKKTYDCNGTNMEESEFRELYRSVIGIVADKQLEEASPSTTPVVTIKYTFNDGSVTEVNVTASTDDQFYQAQLYGKLQVGCSKKQFTELKTALDNAISGKTAESASPSPSAN